MPARSSPKGRARARSAPFAQRARRSLGIRTARSRAPKAPGEPARPPFWDLQSRESTARLKMLWALAFRPVVGQSWASVWRFGRLLGAPLKLQEANSAEYHLGISARRRPPVNRNSKHLISS